MRWVIGISLLGMVLPVMAQHGHSLKVSETDDLSAADVSFYLQRASELLEQREYASALRHFVFAGEIEPSLYRQFVFQYKLAKTYRGLRQMEKAIQYFSHTATDSAFGDFALLSLGELYLAVDSTNQAGSVARQLLRRFPKSALIPHGYYLLLKSTDIQKDDGAWKPTMADLRRILSDYPKLQMQWEPDLLQREARFFIRNRENEQAQAILRRLQNEYPYSQEAYEAWPQLFSFYPSKNNPPPVDDLINALQVRMMQGHHTEALNMIAALRTWYIDDFAHKEIDFMTARIYFAQGKYDLALPRFANLWSDHASAEALFQMGRAARYADEIERSIHAYGQYLQHGKLNDAWSSYIRFEMANNRAIHFDSAAISVVNDGYRSVYQNASQRSHYAVASRFREGLNWYVAGTYDSAIVYWEKYMRSTPSQKTRAQYWIARAYAKKNDIQKAKALYESITHTKGDEYYTTLAHMRLTSHDLRAFYFTDTTDSGNKTKKLFHPVSIPDIGNDPRLDRVAMAIRIGEVAWGEQEAEPLVNDYITRRDRGEKFRDYLESLHAYDLAVDVNVALKKKYRSYYKIYNDDVRMFYPLYYRPLVRHHATAYRLDETLIFALIKSESAFRTYALSPARAIGLMQIMPFTGKALAAETGIPDFQPSSLHEPDVSIHLGSHYLRQLADMYKNYIPAVLGAYNAGPHRATFWMKAFNNEEPDIMPEVVEIFETETYIKRILVDRYKYDLKLHAK